MHAPLLPEDFCLTPDNDPSPAPFGAFAPNAAQAAIIRLAHRTRLKRGAFRPWLSRLVNLLRAGPVDVSYQGASFRFYHQASATERGALFNPAYNIEELDFLRAHIPAGGVFVDVGANVGTYALALARHVGAGGKVIAIDVEGFEDRVLTGFFAEAPQALWPRAIVIEHLSKDEWLADCIADMRARGYNEIARTRSNTLLARG